MIDLTARLALAPLLLAQGIHVRRRALILPEAAGPRRGRIGKGPALTLRIIGDSSGAGVGVEQQSQALAGQLTNNLSVTFDVNWQLDAKTGATTRTTLTRLMRASPEKTDVIVVALGVNDVTHLIPVPVWRRQQRQLFDSLRRLYRPRQIYLSGIPPVGLFPALPHPLRWALGRHAFALQAAQIELGKGSTDITHLPFDIPFDPALMARDGFHPNATLYALWTKKLASRIISDWPKL